MSTIQYAALLEAQPEGGFTVTFPDIPEAITEGDTREEALSHAADALNLCLEIRIEAGEDLPLPRAVKGADWVESSASIQAAMAARTTREIQEPGFFARLFEFRGLRLKS